MNKQSKERRRPSRRDAQLDEFESHDLGIDIHGSGVRPVVIRAKPHATSILLEEDLIDKLRKKGARRGLGYQTMLKMIVREHLDEY